MRKLVLKSLLFGSIVGILFFAIAPLGLGIRTIELLKPILVPSIYLLRIFWETPNNISISYWILAVGLNILIYSVVIFVVILLFKKTER